jgi:hypothetical protein
VHVIPREKPYPILVVFMQNLSFSPLKEKIQYFASIEPKSGKTPQGSCSHIVVEHNTYQIL